MGNRLKYEIDEYVGTKFGRLTIIKEVFPLKKGSTNHRHRKFECLCDCGNIVQVSPYELITREGTKSCGCLQSEVTRNSKRKTQEQFILDSKAKHPDRFHYDKVVYTTNKTNVTIGCILHGDFTVSPANHLKGNGGCPSCKNITIGEKVRKDDEFFLSKSKEVHGDKYDYSKSKYVLGAIPTVVICKEHGEFTILPSEHMRGSGCPACSRDNLFVKEDEFLRRVRKAHGDKYGLDDLGFTGLAEEVTPVCSVHGKFSIIAGNFAKGAGCKLCSVQELKYTTDSFIAKAKTVYEGMYSYEKTEFSGCRKNITVTCEKHGDFERLAFVFLQGHGCRQCKSENSLSGFRSDKPACLYIFELEGAEIGTATGYGITSNIDIRLRRHEINLNKHAIKITNRCYFDFEYGYQALNIETQMKRSIPPSVRLQDVVGFKRESSDTSFKEVISSVDKILKMKGDFTYGIRFEQSC